MLAFLFVYLNHNDNFYFCRLSPKLEGILQIMGVEYVDDLDTVFADQGLLLGVRAQLSFAESQKFEQTYHVYKQLLQNDADESSTNHSVNKEERLAEAERLRHAEKLKRRVEGRALMVFSISIIVIILINFFSPLSSGEETTSCCDT